MKRPTVNVPALVHHKSSNRARVRIEGRDIWLGRWGTPEAQERYRRIVGEWLTHGRVPAPLRQATANSSGPIVNQFILHYWRHAKAYYQKNGRPTSQLVMIRGVLRLLREHYGSTPTAEFDVSALEILQTVLVQQGLSRTGVNRCVDALRKAFKWGVSKKLVPILVYQELLTLESLKKGRSEAPDPPPVGPVPTDDLEKTLPQLGPVIRDMVALQLLSGARPGELCSLRPFDLDQSGEVWEFRPESHKNEHHGKARVVCFGRQGQEILAKYVEGRSPESYCFGPADAEEQRLAERAAAIKTPLSCGNRRGTKQTASPKRRPGDCYTVASYRRAIVRACKRAGVEPWAPNRLRHTRATELRKLFGIEAVRTVLGHSRLSTSELYAERDLAEVRRIMGQVG